MTSLPYAAKFTAILSLLKALFPRILAVPTLRPSRSRDIRGARYCRNMRIVKAHLIRRNEEMVHLEIDLLVSTRYPRHARLCLGRSERQTLHELHAPGCAGPGSAIVQLGGDYAEAS